jgi:glycosyltransferase involved in cell wall biosynthesis
VSISVEPQKASLREKSSLSFHFRPNFCRYLITMKLLVFAHTPPPHHGQSYMVKLMLDGFGGDARTRPAGSRHPLGIDCYHVNARFSRDLTDVGEFQGAKIFLIFWFCLKAIWIRFRHGVNNFYYVPAPGKPVALYRDWLIMFICRPFFKNMILHWHAAGLAKWLETSTTISVRAATYRLFRPVDLSIVLSRYNFADAEKLLSRNIRVVNNGIPDPCPDFEQSILPRRQARLAARTRLMANEPSAPQQNQQTGDDPHIVNVLFLAHCTREKGLFDALESVVIANSELEKTNSPLRLHLTVAGSFINEDEQSEFRQRVKQLAFERPSPTIVSILGFVSGEEKRRAFANSDLFCFPTFYGAESFGLVLVEAMSFGLPIVTTRWRSIPELFPGDYPGLVDVRSPSQTAAALVYFATSVNDQFAQLRGIFQQRFSAKQHLAELAAALRSVETGEDLKDEKE